jgi:hypothetical protein
MTRRPTPLWRVVFAAIYEATCDFCSKKDKGWFWVHPGGHDKGTVCEPCWPGRRIKFINEEV